MENYKPDDWWTAFSLLQVIRTTSTNTHKSPQMWGNATLQRLKVGANSAADPSRLLVGLGCFEQAHLGRAVEPWSPRRAREAAETGERGMGGG